VELQGPDFSDSRDLMIIFSDSWDPIFNSRDTLGFLKHLKNTLVISKSAWVLERTLQNFALQLSIKHGSV